MLKSFPPDPNAVHHQARADDPNAPQQATRDVLAQVTSDDAGGLTTTRPNALVIVIVVVVLALLASAVAYFFLKRHFRRQREAHGGGGGGCGEIRTVAGDRRSSATVVESGLGRRRSVQSMHSEEMGERKRGEGEEEEDDVKVVEIRLGDAAAR
ncbi:hypothetical protein F5Y15DRAFT_422264 [Xylariaceae sp. FL0016]|nr:hypothetical protein F5Y15DRAFT_422264 [Xylariaceae sp. FL0016]